MNDANEMINREGLSDYLQMLCTLLHKNYNEAINLEITFQEWSGINDLNSFMIFLQKITDDGDWPKDDKGVTMLPRHVLDKCVEDEEFFDNLGLAIMLSRMYLRMEQMEKEEREAKNDVH